MEWQQLEYFQVLANMEHVTSAAERLSLTQPALSRSIARLESELGVPLFDRKSRSIYLNRYGKMFLSRVNNILNEYTLGKEELDDLIKPDGGEIVLGFIHTLGAGLVPNLISKFRNKYPKSKFLLNQNGSNFLLSEVAESRIDFCFVSYFDMIPELSYVDLFSEELYLLVPKEHSLAKKINVEILDFKDLPIISFKEGYALRTIIEKVFEESGMKPNITFEGEDVHTIAGLVSSGLGVAVVPDIHFFDKDKILKLPISKPKCRRTISLAWNDNTYLSPIALKFKQFVIDYYRNKN